jgi:hypothetical protein
MPIYGPETFLHNIEHSKSISGPEALLHKMSNARTLIHTLVQGMHATAWDAVTTYMNKFSLIIGAAFVIHVSAYKLPAKVRPRSGCFG